MTARQLLCGRGEKRPAAGCRHRHRGFALGRGKPHHRQAFIRWSPRTTTGTMRRRARDSLTRYGFTRLTKNLIRRPLPPLWEFRKNYAEIIRKAGGQILRLRPSKPISALAERAGLETLWRTVRCSIWRAQGDRAALPRTHGRGNGFGMTRPTPFCAVTPATAIGCSTRPWRRRCGRCRDIAEGAAKDLGYAQRVRRGITSTTTSAGSAPP